MKIYLLTDIPVWVRPLENALRDRGAEVVSGLSVPEGFRPDRVVNRVSTAILRRKSNRVPELLNFLRRAEASGASVLNGADCLEIGLSKRAQHAVFIESGALTPETAVVTRDRRAFADQHVLLKPAAGGFGRGICQLAPHEPIPDALKKGSEWVEQVVLTPSDGYVHRLEFLGPEILYRASSPWESGEFDYCLANVGDAAQLTRGEGLPAAITVPAKAIAASGALQLGALEYLLMSDGSPVFIDFNPVSSLHPGAAAFLGHEPLGLVADYILS